MRSEIILLTEFPNREVSLTPFFLRNRVLQKLNRALILINRNAFHGRIIDFMTHDVYIKLPQEAKKLPVICYHVIYH
jgi:hypothetical protein